MNCCSTRSRSYTLRRACSRAHKDNDCRQASQALAAGRCTLPGSQPSHSCYPPLAALQGSLLLRNGSPMADAFCTTRIGGDHGLAYGTLPRDFDLGVLMARAWAPD